MVSGRVIWIGLVCCLTALGIKLFPDAAFRLGADTDAVWLVFAFGVFLIAMGSLAAGRQERR